MHRKSNIEESAGCEQQPTEVSNSGNIHSKRYETTTQQKSFPVFDPVIQRNALSNSLSRAGIDVNKYHVHSMHVPPVVHRMNRRESNIMNTIFGKFGNRRFSEDLRYTASSPEACFTEISGKRLSLSEHQTDIESRSLQIRRTSLNTRPQKWSSSRS